MKLWSLIAVYFLFFSACEKKDGIAPGIDPDSPTFSTPVTFSARTSTTFTVSWAATDAATSSAALEYQVIYSALDNISTIDTALLNGTVMTSWTANLLTQNFTSMSMATRYYVSIMVRDSEGHIEISSGSANTLCSGKIMFLANVASGNLGGASGADITCNGNKPAGFAASTFKALMTDGTNRRSCFISGNDNCSAVTTGRTDWPLTNSTTYCTSDYETRIGTTNTIGLITVSNPNTLSTATTNTYTGFNVAWGSSASNCSNFISTSGSGIVGSGNGSGSNFYSISIPTCVTAGTIYCAQQ